MSIFLAAFIAIMILMHIAFTAAAILKRNDMADVVWGIGFLFAALGAYLKRDSSADVQLFALGSREFFIVACTALWALRLFWHIGLRTLKKSTEDQRYLNWRKEWGKTWLWRSYLQVFLLQGSLLYVIALPIISAIDRAPGAFTPIVLLGLILWIIGFVIESVGDRQLQTFKANPQNKGKIMTSGLWSWSRHPNYFGEVVQWWGNFAMAFEFDRAWLVISPIAITYLILKVSGIPMLEELMERRPGFQDYKAKTSAFFPLPPRSHSTAVGKNSKT